MHCSIQWNTLRSELCGCAVHCMKYNFSYMHFCPQATYSLALRCSGHCTMYIYTVFIFAINFLSTASQRYAVLHISHTTLYHTEPYFDTLYFWMQYQSSARCAVCTMHTTVHKCTVPAQYTVHTGQWTVYNAWCTTVGEDTLCTVYTTKVGEDEHQRV